MDIKKFLAETEEKLVLINLRQKELLQVLVHLKEKNASLEQKLEAQDKKMKDLENKNINLHLAKKLMGDIEDPRSVRKQIDENIRKIDKCIELLKSM